MQTKITGSANSEMLLGEIAWNLWVQQIGGFCALAYRGTAHIDSRHINFDDAWCSASIHGRTLLIVEPAEFAEQIGQERIGRVLAGFWA